MATYSDTIERLRQRLQQPLPGFSAQERMMARVVAMPVQVPYNARQSAVLCLLFPEHDELHILLMKRREDKTAHSGQVSFPGGSYDANDIDLKATALREANEEIGIMPVDVDILGALSPVYIPVSNFNVYPYVGFAKKRPNYNLNHNEVSYIIEASLKSLFDSERKILADVTSPAVPDVIRKVKAYQLEDGTIIWGATAMMISELEAVMEKTGSL